MIGSNCRHYLTGITSRHAPGAAQLRVACYGDSILSNVYPTDPCTLLQALRPDIKVVQGSLGGRSTQAGIDDYDAFERTQGPFSYVITNLAINDPAQMGETDAKATAQRIRALAAKIRQHGAREIILTPTPATVTATTPGGPWSSWPSRATCGCGCTG